jgi:hypothetical protein
LGDWEIRDWETRDWEIREYEIWRIRDLENKRLGDWRIRATIIIGGNSRLGVPLSVWKSVRYSIRGG